MMVIVYSQDGRIAKIKNVVTIKQDANYIYLTDSKGRLLSQLSRNWIIKLEVF